MLVKIGEYIGFCVYRRSYLLWSPVIVGEFGESFSTASSVGGRRTLVEETDLSQLEGGTALPFSWFGVPGKLQ